MVNCYNELLLEIEKDREKSTYLEARGGNSRIFFRQFFRALFSFSVAFVFQTSGFLF